MTIGKLSSFFTKNPVSLYGGILGACAGSWMIHRIHKEIPSNTPSDRLHKSFVHVNFAITGALCGAAFKLSAPMLLVSCIAYKLIFNQTKH